MEEYEDKNSPDETPSEEISNLSDSLHLSGMFKNWYLDYASYVILERAVPAIEDGLKPVQRRILHAMNEIDDGRFNKVANIIGQTMQYHPHGDASIGDAIVNLGQKDLLIETQGNWGDIRTGDRAAAPRYIEARLSKFAKEILFNKQTTEWQLSYDGRKKEPITLPAKFPLLLAQGVEGIAVGLTTKILPHNFCEILEACIAYLNNKPFELFPDFPTGGLVDVSNYNDGKRGGKIRVRAKIEDVDRKILIIRDIPFGTTTVSLMDSIVAANEKGKIKIKKVVDNTAKDVEIQIHLAPGVSPDITIDALYAFTDCEVSISPNTCVISNGSPQFIGVSDILKHSVDQTMGLLKKELEIRKGELMEKLLFSSLEKIFIENRIYRDIEEIRGEAEIIATVHKGLDPYKPSFYREITDEDVQRLLKIEIRRISRHDSYKADELMRQLQIEMDEVENHLAHLRQYTIAWFKQLLKKYGAGKERKSEFRTFDTITAAVVAANNQKLYVNRAEGFIGYGLKKDEFITDCSDIDDVIVFLKNGKYKVVKIGEKVFVGKDILHAAIFRKNDDRTTYNLVYYEGESGYSMVKRFQVTGVTRDKEYDVTAGTKGSKITYLTVNPNGEAEIIGVSLTATSSARQKAFDYDFAKLEIKGRSSKGNILTKYPVRKIVFKVAGLSTLGGLDIWYDTTIGRLNYDKRGRYLGKFDPNDLVLAIYKEGSYELTTFELTNRYEPENTILVAKFSKETPISITYYDSGSKTFYIKRFLIETSTLGKKFQFIGEEKGTYVLGASHDEAPQLEIITKGDKKSPPETSLFDADIIAEVKGWKALGNKLPIQNVGQATFIIQEMAPAIEENTESDAIETKGLSLFD